MTHACGLQDASKRNVIDAAREDTRLFKIASELADEEERKRQWRVARGEVNQHFCYRCKTLVCTWIVPYTQISSMPGTHSYAMLQA